MIKKWTVVVILLIVFIPLGLSIKASRSERAFDVRNTRDVEKNGNYGFPAKWMRDTRWANVERQLKECPSIPELTSARVSKTQDANTWVIELRGIDGRECSLWLVSGEDNRQIPIRSISPY